MTRDYALELDGQGAPLLSIYGGKITTFRRLAEEAVDKLAPWLGWELPCWTANAPLPGGDFPGADFAGLLAGLAARFPLLDPAMLTRMAHAYGSRVERVLAAGDTTELVPGLLESELAYLEREEWALTPEDVLWRRSKLGLHLAPEARTRVSDWLEGRRTRQE